MRLAALFIVLLGLNASLSAHAEDADPFAAYRARDYVVAWSGLNEAALQGDRRAARYVANILLEGAAPIGGDSQPARGVQMLVDLASEGDYPSLIKLNTLRDANAPYAPSIEAIIEIEKTLARRGDPVAAWRLARRYQAGEGVAASFRRASKWLEVAALASPDEFPKAPDAALELCGLFIEADAGKARQWCGVAAEAGKPAARIAMRRLAQLPG